LYFLFALCHIFALDVLMQNNINKIRLGVNIDHVATVRNARGGEHPCPVAMALLAQNAGADGITAHLREDRRHVRDADIFRLKETLQVPLNFEMAATAEMQDIALKVRPNAVCLVPEKRTELTTEGGLNVVAGEDYLREYIKPLKANNIRISLFVDSDLAQIEAAKKVGADIVELHTGAYCEASGELQAELLQKLIAGADYADNLGIEVHAGHGLDYATTEQIMQIKHLQEVNIGHFIIGEALQYGLSQVIARFNGILKR
jgi:pyridoxine 5-phosphate synthase